MQEKVQSSLVYIRKLWGKNCLFKNVYWENSMQLHTLRKMFAHFHSNLYVKKDHKGLRWGKKEKNIEEELESTSMHFVPPLSVLPQSRSSISKLIIRKLFWDATIIKPGFVILWFIYLFQCMHYNCWLQQTLGGLQNLIQNKKVKNIDKTKESGLKQPLKDSITLTPGLGPKLNFKGFQNPRRKEAIHISWGDLFQIMIVMMCLKNKVGATDAESAIQTKHACKSWFWEI